ncbi:MAG: hypothetical protein AABX05_04040 [Nanoarchaeota archaeon]
MKLPLSEQEILYDGFINRHKFGIVDLLNRPNESYVCDGSNFVYLISKNQELAVLKIAARFKGQAVGAWEYRQVVRENKVLDHTLGMPNIVNKHSYHSKKIKGHLVIALVRDYIEGEPLQKFGGHKKKINTLQQKTIEDTVRLLHKGGCAFLDLAGWNIIINKQGIPYFIDLGTARLRNKTSQSHYDFLVQRDLVRLDELFEGLENKV